MNLEYKIQNEKYRKQIALFTFVILHFFSKHEEYSYGGVVFINNLIFIGANEP